MGSVFNMKDENTKIEAWNSHFVGMVTTSFKQLLQTEDLLLFHLYCNTYTTRNKHQYHQVTLQKSREVQYISVNFVNQRSLVDNTR